VKNSKVKLIFFSIVVCPEMAICLLIPFSYIVLHPVLAPIVSGLALPPDKLKFLSLFPTAMLLFTLRDFKAILQPEHSNKDILLQWPGYWALKVAYFGAVTYQGLYALIALSVWLSGGTSLTVWVALALVLPIIGALVSYGTILLAKAKVQEVLSKYAGR
jgi:hypothetical protein